MSSVSELEAEAREYRQQLEMVHTGLQADPDNAELQNLVNELQEVISLTESAIAELKPASAVASSSRIPPPPPVPTSPNQEKWSKENHPAFQPGYQRSGAPSTSIVPPPPADHADKEDHPVTYKVNDLVSAKWKSGDKAFYPAKITSITGSSSKPVYIVTFKGYNSTETLFAHEIRPLGGSAAGQKRKADGQPSTSNTSAGAAAGPTTSYDAGSPGPLTPGIISAAASIDPALASAARKPEPSRVGDGPPRPPKMPKKIKANKELEKGKNNWQEFAAGKGKMGKLMKKDSMFKTGEGVNARVGFTGSGHTMRKDQARTRHIYDKGGEEDF